MWTHPALTDEQWTHRLRVACEFYRHAGFELVLVAKTIETDEELAQLVAAVGADERLLVRLEARPDTLAGRIVEREPASWSGLPDIVAHAQALAETMPPLRGVDFVVSTEGRRPEDVAADIRAACPDRVAASASGRPR